MTISILGVLIGVAVLLAGYGQTGQRRRRPGFIAGGWILVILTGIPAVMFIIIAIRQNISWLQLTSTDQLLAKVEASDSYYPSVEFGELTRRLDRGKLDNQQKSRLGKITLDRFVGEESGVQRVYICVLNRLRGAGHLTAKQQAQFFNRLVDIDFEAMTPVAADRGIPFRIDIAPLGDWRGCGLWCGVEIATAPELAEGSAAMTRAGFLGLKALEARRSPAPKGPILMRGPTGIIWQAEAAATDPGKRELTCNVKASFYDEKPGTGVWPQAVHTITRRLSATAKVVPADASTPVRLTTDVKRRPDVRHPDADYPEFLEWRFQGNRFHVHESPNGRFLSVAIDNENPEVDCAFDAAIEVDHVEHPAGTIVQRKGEIIRWRMTAPCPEWVPETIALKFTPNVELARECGLREIWGEVVEIDNVRRAREDRRGRLQR